ncbi:MAG TPA: hypothetical protein VGD39_18190 [Nocardioides sp.]
MTAIQRAARRRAATTAAALVYTTAAAALAGCSALGSTDGSTDERSSVSWQDAADHVGERVEVCGPLRSTGSDGDDRFFNLGAPYPEEPRFTIVVWDNPDSVQPVNARTGSYRVCVRGEVSMYQGVPQMELGDGRRIDITPR